MNTFAGLFFYMVVGGLLVFPAVKKYDAECKASTTTADFASAVIVWPAILVAALMQDGTTETKCKPALSAIEETK